MARGNPYAGEDHSATVLEARVKDVNGATYYHSTLYTIP